MKRLLWVIPWLLTAGVLRADKQEPVVIAKPEAFKTLVNPNCSHCRDEAKRRAAQLRDDDRVLCWIRGYSDGGAIPLRFFLHSYPVISDSYGVFVYDSEAGFLRGFGPSYDFSFYGWRNGVMVMKHKDGTLYSCLTGIGFEGPNKGKRLKVIPTLASDWGFWLNRYPGAVAYHMFDKYQPIDLPTIAHPDSSKSRGPADPRLPPDSSVLGVVDNKSSRAYPLDTLSRAGLITDTVDGKTRVVLWYEPTKTAAAYEPIASPPTKDPPPGKPVPPPAKDAPPPQRVTLQFDAKGGPAPFVDKETGSRWDIAGRGVDGRLKGWTLAWLDSTQVKWFAWAAEYPETALFSHVLPRN
jgi:hypothetical protein